MTDVVRLVAIAAVALLAGCQSVPEPVVSTPACPEPEIPACPPCEIFECPEPRVLERLVQQPAPPAPPPRPQPRTGGALNLPIIGSVEYVQLEDPGLRLEGLMNTAAELTALRARDIQVVEKDGQQHVLYTLVDPATEGLHNMDSPLQRRATLQLADGSSRRVHIVRMWMTLGDNRVRVEVALVDSESMPYPVVAGRNLLTDVAIVDVSQRHTLASP